MNNPFNKLFGSIKRKAASLSIGDKNILSIFGKGGRSIGSGMTNSGVSEYKNWVYACVTARSEDVGNMDLYLEKNGEKVEDHELLDLLYQVNPYMTMFELFEATQAFKDLDGNAFWYLAKAENGTKIEQIYILRPDKVNIVLNKDNPLQIEGYTFTAQDGSKVPFTPEEILHFRNFNPMANHPFPHRGMGIVQAAAWAIDTDNEVRTWNYNFFKNSAKPDGILYSEGGAMDAAEHKRLSAQWKQEHQGAENAHKIAILSGGVKWQEITRSQKDMDFIGQRNMGMTEILSMFRVPKFILGMTDEIQRANAEASLYVYMLRSIKPAMQRIVDTLNEFLAPRFEDKLEIKFVSPVPDDRAQIIAEYTAGCNKWLTRNEIRAMEGLAPTENGNEIMGTLSDTPIDTFKEPKKSAKVSPKPQRKSASSIKIKTASAAEKAIDDFVAKLPQATEKAKKVAEEKAAEYVVGWEKAFDANVKPLKKKLDQYFDAQKAEVMKNLKEELKGLEAKEYHFKGVDDMLFDEDAAITAGINLITPFLKQYIKDSGTSASRLVDTEFDSTSEGISRFVTERAKFFSKNINDTTRDALFTTIKEGIDNGEDLADISERVAGVYDIAVGSRTDKIARTEVSAASNFGSVEAYKQAGVEQHEWKAIGDDRTSDECMSCDGQVVKIGDSFNSGEDQPPNHPNCRCTTLPIFND